MKAPRRIRSEGGFGLVELTIVLVVVGIMVGIAMQSAVVVSYDARRSETEREMDELANAIVGNAALQQDGLRSDYGYVGDVGAFPANLQALFTNPGGLPTWDGPYVRTELLQDSVSYLLDGWGQAYSYSGGITITSTGSGSTMIKKIADAGSDYLLNSVAGSVRDRNDSLPGAIKKDSVDIRVVIPKGSSGLVTKTYHPDAAGNFQCDSIPAGVRHFQVIYRPASDTIDRYFTVLPRQQPSRTLDVRFSQAYFSTPAAAGPVAWWKLDETSGNSTADASGNGRTGTLVNFNTATCWVAGVLDGALNLDGSNDYVTFGNINPASGAITVTAWVRPSSIGTDRQIVSKGFDGLKTQWELKTTSASGKVSFRHWAPGAVGVESVNTLTVSTWTHVAGTFDGTTWRIYWNGVLDNSAVNTGPVATPRRLLIGAVDINGTPGQFWNGRIDDVRIYDRALSAAEISALMY